ncbi:response regulator [Clostridium sp. C2-6-12]|uniref:response regulator n=1 Tax=Clostridium sp. C2-6-12 TaxID=2698832 RepID=UPI001368C54A|nr:response regulator [Clostridium sp. C2-6-12]
MNENNKPLTDQKAKVLIVDDSIVTLKIEENLMKSYGVDVTTAKSGKECIALLNANRYDIIFMDHLMPEMDGIETTKRIRKMKDDYYRDVIIIALSASIAPNIYSVYIKNGFNDFLEKPINTFKLNDFLRTYLPRKYIIETKLFNNKESGLGEILIKDVDTKKAIQNCGGIIDNYLSLLSVAYNDGKNKIKLIKDYALKEDITNYTIEVHALKTVANLIGHDKLAQLSKRHEIAGTNNNLSFILKNVDFLLASYDELLNNIKSVLPEEHLVIKEKNKNYTIEDLNALANFALESIDNFDLDAINESLDHLLHYDLSQYEMASIEKTKSFINIFDYDNASNEIKNFKNSLYMHRNS